MKAKTITIIALLLSLATIVGLVKLKNNYVILNKKEFTRNRDKKIVDMYDNKLSGILFKDEDGVEYFLDPKDKVITESFVLSGVWEMHLRNILKQTIKPGNVGLCIGAHEGSHVALISKLVGNDGRIFAFEPNTGILPFLKHTIYFSTNKNITLYENAAYSENTTLNFMSIDADKNSGGSYVMSSTDPDNPLGKRIFVKSIRIDDITDIKSADFIQMDIEGSEPHAMEGAKNLIKNSPNLIVFQEWSVVMMKGENATKNYIKFWRDFGFKFAEIKCDSLVEKTDSELLALPHTDVFLSRDLDNIIKNFKPCS